MVKYPNEIMEKTSCKEIISDTNYTPIVSGTNIMDLPDNTEQIKSDINMWLEN